MAEVGRWGEDARKVTKQEPILKKNERGEKRDVSAKPLERMKLQLAVEGRRDEN